MVTTLTKSFLLAAALAAIGFLLPLAPRAATAFAAGEALFAFYVTLLVLIADRMMRSRVERGEKSRAGGALLTFGLGLKVFGVGCGAYLALVVCGLRADFFVGGAVAGLSVFVAFIYSHSLRPNKTLAPS